MSAAAAGDDGAAGLVAVGKDLSHFGGEHLQVLDLAGQIVDGLRGKEVRVALGTR